MIRCESEVRKPRRRAATAKFNIPFTLDSDPMQNPKLVRAIVIVLVLGLLLSGFAALFSIFV